MYVACWGDYEHLLRRKETCWFALYSSAEQEKGKDDEQKQER